MVATHGPNNLTYSSYKISYLNPCLMTMYVSNPRAALIQILDRWQQRRVGNQRLSLVSMRRKTTSWSEMSFSRASTSLRIFAMALAVCVCECLCVCVCVCLYYKNIHLDILRGVCIVRVGLDSDHMTRVYDHMTTNDQIQ